MASQTRSSQFVIVSVALALATTALVYYNHTTREVSSPKRHRSRRRRRRRRRHKRGKGRQVQNDSRLISDASRSSAAYYSSSSSSSFSSRQEEKSEVKEGAALLPPREIRLPCRLETSATSSPKNIIPPFIVLDEEKHQVSFDSNTSDAANSDIPRSFSFRNSGTHHAATQTSTHTSHNPLAQQQQQQQSKHPKFHPNEPTNLSSGEEISSSLLYDEAPGHSFASHPVSQNHSESLHTTTFLPTEESPSFLLFESEPVDLIMPTTTATTTTTTAATKTTTHERSLQSSVRTGTTLPSSPPNKNSQDSSAPPADEIKSRAKLSHPNTLHVKTPTALPAPSQQHKISMNIPLTLTQESSNISRRGHVESLQTDGCVVLPQLAETAISTRDGFPIPRPHSSLSGSPKSTLNSSSFHLEKESSSNLLPPTIEHGENAIEDNHSLPSSTNLWLMNTKKAQTETGELSFLLEEEEEEEEEQQQFSVTTSPVCNGDEVKVDFAQRGESLMILGEDDLRKRIEKHKNLPSSEFFSFAKTEDATTNMDEVRIIHPSIIDNHHHQSSVANIDFTNVHTNGDDDNGSESSPIRNESSHTSSTSPTTAEVSIASTSSREVSNKNNDNNNNYQIRPPSGLNFDTTKSNEFFLDGDDDDDDNDDDDIMENPVTSGYHLRSFEMDYIDEDAKSFPSDECDDEEKIADDDTISLSDILDCEHLTSIPEVVESTKETSSDDSDFSLIHTNVDTTVGSHSSVLPMLFSKNSLPPAPGEHTNHIDNVSFTSSSAAAEAEGINGEKKKEKIGSERTADNSVLAKIRRPLWSAVIFDEESQAKEIHHQISSQCDHATNNDTTPTPRTSNIWGPSGEEGFSWSSSLQQQQQQHRDETVSTLTTMNRQQHTEELDLGVEPNSQGEEEDSHTKHENLSEEAPERYDQKNRSLQYSANGKNAIIGHNNNNNNSPGRDGSNELASTTATLLLDDDRGEDAVSKGAHKSVRDRGPFFDWSTTSLSGNNNKTKAGGSKKKKSRDAFGSESSYQSTDGRSTILSYYGSDEETSLSVRSSGGGGGDEQASSDDDDDDDDDELDLAELLTIFFKKKSPSSMSSSSRSNRQQTKKSKRRSDLLKDEDQEKEQDVTNKQRRRQRQQENRQKKFNFKRNRKLAKIDVLRSESLCCTCHDESTFPQKYMQKLELFLPKVYLGHICDRCQKESRGYLFQEKHLEKEVHGHSYLDRILRPWQVEFLSSIGILTLNDLVQEHNNRNDGNGNNNAKIIAKKMKAWRTKQQMKNVKSQACYVALYIWARTAEHYCKADR